MKENNRSTPIIKPIWYINGQPRPDIATYPEANEELERINSSPMGRHYSKYVTHESGLPIRLAPYIRAGLRNGNLSAITQQNMIQKDPCIGNRSSGDILPTNLQENIRLRKIAWRVSRDLVSVAENLQSKSYCTVVHGSLSKGLIRDPLGDDKSDIDIDLVFSDIVLPEQQRLSIRELFHQKAEYYGSKIDTYVLHIDDLKQNVGEIARRFLRASAYPIANKNKLWEEILWIGLESKHFSDLMPAARRRVRKILSSMSNGEIATIPNCTPRSAPYEQVCSYFKDRGINGKNNDPELISKLASILKTK